MCHGLMALDPSHSSLEGKFVDHMEDALENVVVSFKEIIDGGVNVVEVPFQIIDSYTLVVKTTS